MRTNVKKLEGDGREGEWLLENISPSPLVLKASTSKCTGQAGASWPAALGSAEAEATAQTCILSNPPAHYAVASLGLPYALFPSFQYRGNQH